jgi:hypothetical protein
MKSKAVLLLALCAAAVQSILAQPVGYVAGFQTLGKTFSPAVYCDAGTPQTFLWTWSDGSTSSTFPIVTKTFNSAAARYQYLTVSPARVLTQINLGWDGSDGGWTNIYVKRSQQNVGAVYFPAPLTNLQYWASSYNPIGNTLDFTGFTALQNVECWHCTNLQHVVVANLPALRRVCVEGCNLQELDLSGDPNLEDVRGALNSYTSVTLGKGTGPKIWHWCFRDNPQLIQDFMSIMTNFYSLREPWFWDANQAGALKFVSTNLTDVEVYLNSYTSADFTGQSNMSVCLVYDNSLTNLVITGCTALQTFDAHANQLPSAVLDSVLAELDASATNLASADLSQNAQFPSYIGYAHYANLVNRGALVTLDWPPYPVAWPQVVPASTTLVAESCLPTNNAIDPGETVTVLFALQNQGSANTTNLVVTLLATNGVLAPSEPQTYGALVAGGAAVARPFTFTAQGTCGGSVTPILQLRDNAGILGTVAVSLPLGQAIPFWTENFDAVTAPALPPGWTTWASGAQVPWVTDTSAWATPRNSAFAPDQPNPGLTALVSPPIVLPRAPIRLTFQNYCNLEPAPNTQTGYDGGVLEIQIGTNAFTDILAAGGSFVTGGYNRTLATPFQNPLGGRLAWSAPVSGFSTVTVNLPPSAAGQTIQLRWLCGTDVDNGNTMGSGWHIDSIALSWVACCGAASPPLVVQFIGESGGVATLSWSALPGRTYRLQFKNQLEDAWSNVIPDVTATGTTASATNATAGSSSRFYRVLLLP